MLASPAAATHPALSRAEAIRATARNLGLALPRFTAAAHPELFQAWADRVAWAEIVADRPAASQKASLAAALDECDRQLGVPASRLLIDIASAPRPAVVVTIQGAASTKDGAASTKDGAAGTGDPLLAEIAARLGLSHELRIA